MEITTNTMTYIFLFLLALLSYSYVMKKYKAKQQIAQPQPQPRLPPGSMGWSYLGETLQLYSQDPNVFFASKQKRYGEIFKTHILGCPCIMLASPEAARFVLVTHAHLFKPTYPKSKEELIGPSALFFHQGEYHTCIRKLVQSSLSPEIIKRIIPDIEATAISSLESWAASGQVIHVFHEMKKVPLTSGKLSVLCSSIKTIMNYVVTKFPNFSFNVAIITIFGHDLKDKYKDLLKDNYRIIDKGYNSFPTRIPGTAYSKALKARKRLGQILSEIIRQRKERGLVIKDLLGYLLNYEDDKGQTLTEDQIADNVIGVLFAAQDTTASVLTWILKYLHDNKKLLEAVKAEQMEIYEANVQGRRPLTWAQTRNMPLTYRVILESLRMASIISFTFREAVAGVAYKGYLIPKGWKVMPLFRNIHHNPEFFTAPEKFDPSRFEVAPKPNTFLPFGNGVHSCPGNGLTKLDMLIFIHHLVTKFRWDVLETDGGIQYSPFPVPLHGLPARFWKEPQTCKQDTFVHVN